MKISLARAFGWSLYAIDQADFESTVRFLMRYNQAGQGTPKQATVYCDQADWL
jgi:hypothetical protein